MIQLRNVNFPKKLCPFLFRNFDVYTLALASITNSFLIKNRLNFYQLNSTKVVLKFLNELIFGLTYESLNTNNLSPVLFRNIKYLSIAGVLNSIDTELFKVFQELISICVQIKVVMKVMVLIN
jgi:hypothetical protein